MLNMPKPYNLGVAQCIPKDGETFKNPMLVVGANNYIRENVLFSITERFDIHLFFFPNSEAVWRLGIVLVPRQGTNAPISHYVESRSIQECTARLLVIVNNASNNVETLDIGKRSSWLLHSIYRCPKISLKDVLHLDTYKEVA